MAIILQKANMDTLFRMGIVETLSVYKDDVLIATVSDESSWAWTVTVLDSANTLGNDLTFVIQLSDGETMNLSALPTVVYEGAGNNGSVNSASVVVQDVTLYVPGEYMNLAASPPVVYDVTKNVSGSAFAGASPVTFINIAASVSALAYAPGILEGPSGSASAGSASVTLF